MQFKIVVVMISKSKTARYISELQQGCNNLKNELSKKRNEKKKKKKKKEKKTKKTLKSALLS